MSFIRLIREFSEYIYLSAKGFGILQFDISGNFIRKFGKHGRGPGEYNYGMNFAVDEQSGSIYIIDKNKIKFFLPSGDFYKEVAYDKYIGGFEVAGNIEFFNSMLFLPDYLTQGDSRFNWVLLDTTGKLVTFKKNSLPPFGTKFVMPGGIYMFGNKICYYNCFNDTIFSISPDLKYKTEYLFAKGLRFPKTGLNFVSESQFMSAIYDLFIITYILETEKYLIFEYRHLDKVAFALIDKKTHRTFAGFTELENSTYRKTKPFIKNDLDGGLPLLSGIRYYSASDCEYLITLINPSDIKKHVLSSVFLSSRPKIEEREKMFRVLADSIQITDNPVLVFMKLK